MSSSISSSLTSLSSSISSASSAASSAFSSATAKAAPDTGSSTSTTGTIFTSLTAILTILAIAAAGIYFAGYADDVAQWFGKRYYKGKAIAEVKVLENSGSEKLQSLAQDSLKKNPVVGEGELNQVTDGVGNASGRISALSNL